VILIIHDPVYKQDVVVAVGVGDGGAGDERKILRSVIRAGYQIDDTEEMADLLKFGPASGRTVMDKESGAVVIRIRRLRPGNAADIGHLVHECVHAATMLFERIGFPLRSDTDEPLAYYIQFLVQSVLDRRGRVTGNKKTWRKK